MDEKQTSESIESSSFFQKPTFNAFERLVCSHLIEASKSEPLQTVIHISRAALALTDEVAAQLKIDKAQARSLYTVSQRLISALKKTDKFGIESVYVSFATVNIEKDIKPWRKAAYYPFTYEDSDKEEITRLKSKGAEAIFRFTNSTLLPQGYESMLSDFLEYAIPAAEEMGRKLAELVSPETYTELLKLYYGDRP